MEQGHTTWTDARLENLARRVDDGFSRRDRRFDELQMILMQFAGALTIVLFAALLGFVLTQS